MNLKRRLILSNTLVVLVPAAITAAAALLYLYISVPFGRPAITFDNVRKAIRIESSLFSAGAAIWKENPETLAGNEFQQFLTAKLSGIEAGVAVMRGSDLIYASMPLKVEEALSALESGASPLTRRSFVTGGVSYLLSSYSFTFTGDIPGHILFLVPAGKEVGDAWNFIVSLILIFLISFLAANMIFSANISKSIAGPLGKLKIAVWEIMKGSLDHGVTEEGDEEIREVSRALENMRLRLQDSVASQMKYEDNRKMLVSSISHDLKTPVTSIKGYVEGILDGVADTPEKQEKYLRTIYMKAALLDTMIDDLLLYSKLDLNQLPFDFELTDISEYMEAIVREVSADMEKDRISFIYEDRLRSPLQVMADRPQLRRAISNVLDNSAKYLVPERKGEIRLILRKTADSVVIEVSDNGKGIPEESLPLVFNRFYRADGARSAIPGSGLGLAIAERIVSGHGGSIWIKSRVGEGTQCMISIKIFDGAAV